MVSGITYRDYDPEQINLSEVRLRIRSASKYFISVKNNFALFLRPRFIPSGTGQSLWDNGSRIDDISVKKKVSGPV